MQQTASLVELVLPWLAWVAVFLLVGWWLVRRWESQLTARQSYTLKFPLSPMAFLNRRLIIEGLVQDQQVQAAMKSHAQQTGEHLASVEKRVRRQAHELVPAFKAVFYFSIGYWLARLLLRTMYQVRLVRDAREEYAKIRPDATVVLLMNHRSNMDVVLVNYLLARHSAVAHAAGEWARLWPLHHLVRLAGNYVVDRDSNDPVYRLVLKRYVQMAVTHGIHLAIFPEGSLTRDGRLRPLSFGLLNYAATASWPGLDRDVVFIPVSFSYDQVPEQERLVFGDTREFADRGRLHLLWASLRFIGGFLRLPFRPRDERYGWACATFGQPLSLRSWQRSQGIDLRTSPRDALRRHIGALGQQLMGEVLHSMPVLPVHLVATALTERDDASMKLNALEARVEELRVAVEAAGAPVFVDPAAGGSFTAEGLHTLVQVQAIEVPAEETITAVPARLALLHYYAQTIAHYLPESPPAAGGALPAKPRNPRNYLATVYESFARAQERTVDDQDFFERFYQEFLSSSPAVSEQFSGTDMSQQQQHLKASLKHMVDYCASGTPSVRLRQMARMHGRGGRAIAGDLYDLWLRSLIKALSLYDSAFDQRVELSWRSVMAPGIDYMRSQFDYPEEQSTVPVSDTPIVSQGIARWVDHWAERAPDRPAVKSAQRSLSYGELADEAGRLAAGLHSRLGVNSGDRVAFLAANCVEFIVLLFACARLGAVLVPINFRLATAERERLVQRTESRAILLDRSHADQPLTAIPDCVPIHLEDAPPSSPGVSYRELLQVPGAMRTSDGNLDSPLLIVFTSGSTGDPKGAVLTQAAVQCNALNSRVMHDMTRNDHVATCLPFFHVGGINIQTLPAFQVGASVTIFSRFDPERFVDFVASERPTLTVLVPAQMQVLMDLPTWQRCDLSSLRMVTTGSTIVSQELIQAWADKGVPVIQVYGCTESGPIAAHQTIEGIRSGWATVGHAALYTEVRVADEQGQPAAVGVEGEVLLRGANLASHYWRDESATREVFQDGWLHTGDLGYLDQNGRLRIVGRKKRLIISGGENIHPAEIEQVLEAHAGVIEAAVVGLSDDQWGEVPVAVVVITADGPDEAALRRHLDQHLGRYKHPNRILFVDALPRTGLDKIAYPEVQELIKGGA